MNRPSTDRREAATLLPHGLGGIRIVLCFSGYEKARFAVSNLPYLLLTVCTDCTVCVDACYVGVVPAEVVDAFVAELFQATPLLENGRQEYLFNSEVAPLPYFTSFQCSSVFFFHSEVFR